MNNNFTSFHFIWEKNFVELSRYSPHLHFINTFNFSIFLIDFSEQIYEKIIFNSNEFDDNLCFHKFAFGFTVCAYSTNQQYIALMFLHCLRQPISHGCAADRRFFVCINPLYRCEVGSVRQWKNISALLTRWVCASGKHQMQFGTLIL